MRYDTLRDTETVCGVPVGHIITIVRHFKETTGENIGNMTEDQLQLFLRLYPRISPVTRL